MNGGTQRHTGAGLQALCRPSSQDEARRMTTTPVRSDATLRHLLLEELDREAGVDATRTGVVS